MPDMMATAFAWHADQLEEHASTTITYRRGTDSVSFPAIIGKSSKSTTSEGGSRFERASADIWFRPEYLDFGDGPVEPLDGDIVEQPFGDVLKRFRVAPLGNEPAWRYAEGYQQHIVVHMKALNQSDRVTITVTPSSIGNRPVNVAFSVQLKATGGVDSCTFAVTSGAVPTGMTLSSAGLLSGTPTVAGAFSFTVTATDGVGDSGERPYTLVITP